MPKTATKRTDKKGRILKTGESLRKDGRYAFKYVDKIGKSHFIYSWRLNDSDPLPKGKKPCKSLRELEKEIQRDIDVGINHAGAKKMTVCDLYRMHNNSKSNVRESTVKSREQLMKVLQNDRIGSMSIDKIYPIDAKEWVKRMKEQGFAYQTINNYKRSLKASFYTAIEHDYVRKNPFNFNTDDVIKNDTESKIVLTDEQAESLLHFLQTDCTYQKHFNAVMVLLHTGLRISELCGLTVDDIDFTNGYINIDHQIIFNKGTYRIEQPKTDCGIRKVPMSDSVRNALKDEIQNRENAQPVAIDGYENFIFLNHKGLPYYNTGYSAAFNAMITKYNKHHNTKLPKFTPHDLRRTYCTNMANKTNIKPKALQYIMGHKNITTTWGYYAHCSAELAKADYDLLAM